MKKIYKFLFAVTICLSAFGLTYAQVANQISTPLKSKLKVPQGHNIIYSTIKPHYSVQTGLDTSSVWMNDLLANDYVLGGGSTGPASLGAYPLFPDSTMLFPFSNGNGGTVWGNNGVDIIGNILDPLAANMATYEQATYPSFSWNQFNDYTVDSMAIGYVYFRNTDASVVDTLVVYLYNDSNPSDAPYSGFEKFLNNAKYPQFIQFSPLKAELPYLTGLPAADTSLDTLEWKNQLYNPTTNTPLVSSTTTMRTYKIPLTSTDTNSFTNGVISFGTNSYGYSTTFHVPGGKQACSAVGFIPGYTYSMNPPDSISHYNQFDIIYAQENGADQWPTYFGSGGIVNGTHDWNISSTITTFEEYELAPGNQSYEDSLFENAYLYDSTYFLDEYMIYYKVTSTFNTGIPTFTSLGDLELYQNIPNPANHTTLIQYNTKSEGAATLVVTDLTGRIVMTMDQGNQAAGLHSVTVDLSGLSQGMYLYTLRTNSESLTKRMVIN